VRVYLAICKSFKDCIFGLYIPFVRVDTYVGKFISLIGNMRPLKLEEYMMNQLKDRVAVITGVSRLDGIGAATCKELAEAGYDIFFTYWTAYDKEMPWGVDKVIDYTKEDFTKRGGEDYDVIFDAVGKYKKSLCKQVLTPNGIYVSVNGMMAKVSKEDMFLLKKLTETENLKPVIDRTYRLEEIAEAHMYVENGHKKGNVSITLK